jgi:hypothetical protein
VRDWFVDEQSRVVVSRGSVLRTTGDDGVPTSQSLPPTVKWNLVSPESVGFSAINVQHMQSLGLKHVRLTLEWEFVEPQPLVYNESYVDSFLRTVDLLESYGIYTMLSMNSLSHSRVFYAVGAPAWAIFGDGGYPVNITTWACPLRIQGLASPFNCVVSTCNVGQRDNIYEKYVAMNAFLTNAVVPSTGLGLQEHLGLAWRYVAARASLKHRPGLLGYRLYNNLEPYNPSLPLNNTEIPCESCPNGCTGTSSPPGTLFNNAILQRAASIECPLPIVPGTTTAGGCPSSAVVWKDWHNRITTIIRSVDRERFIFWQPFALDLFGLGTVGPDNDTLISYSPHWGPSANNGTSPGLTLGQGPEAAADLFRARARGDPLVLATPGAAVANVTVSGLPAGGALMEGEHPGATFARLSYVPVLNAMFSRFMPATFYAYWQDTEIGALQVNNLVRNLSDPYGTQNTVRLDRIIKPYAQSIAGTPLTTSYDPTTKVFLLTYSTVKIESAAEAEARGCTQSEVTEIFLARYQYPNGSWLSLSGASLDPVCGAFSGDQMLRLRNLPGASTVSVRLDRSINGTDAPSPSAIFISSTTPLSTCSGASVSKSVCFPASVTGTGGFLTTDVLAPPQNIFGGLSIQHTTEYQYDE